MTVRNQVQVIIGGKIYSLYGYESEEYLQKVAAYLNRKIQECRETDSYKKLSSEMRSIMLDLNIADDYFKIRSRIDALEADISGREKELYELKQELITTQVRLESAEQEIASLREKTQSDQEMMLKMDKELTGRRKKNEKNGTTGTGRVH